MSTETMSVETKATPQITRAAERYLEQYGDPLVMNTYLKVTILVLAVVCVSLAGLAYKSQTALANMHPMIVRINDVGHAEAIDYRKLSVSPPGGGEQVLPDPLGGTVFQPQSFHH